MSLLNVLQVQPSVAIDLIKLLVRLEELEQAEAISRSLVEGHAQSAVCFKALADILARQGRLEEAVAAYNDWAAVDLENNSERTLQQNKAASRGVPLVFIVAMHKSASEYIELALTTALDCPSLYPSTPTFPKDLLIPALLSRAAQGGIVVRTHTGGSPDNIEMLRKEGIQRLVIHTRDPRQVTLSWVHMIRRIDDERFQFDRLLYTPRIPIEFRNWKLDMQLGWAVENYFPQLMRWSDTWAQSIPQLSDFEIEIMRYERFHGNPAPFLEKLVGFFGADTSSIAQTLQSVPPAAQPNFRRAQIDEWRDVFGREQQNHMAKMIKAQTADCFSWVV